MWCCIKFNFNFAEFDLPEKHEAFDAHANPQDKDFMNDILCREAAHLRGTGKALILDGCEHLTTHALRRSGFTDANIVIANSNESTCAALQACLPQVDVRFCSMIDCLESPAQERFAVVYLDYCGSFGGRQSTCAPSYEMELLFSKKLNERAIVAYTFCKRTAVRMDPSIPDSELAWRTFQHIACKYGYVTRNVASRHYRQMFTACFRVERIATTSDFLMRDM
ncbi:hypothetical protein JKP88DRAFT_248439 [Tribonema minus]|uniref:Uncharacterized protein n=1 Tax=Tribonema minus TaxID=303371 RepID=A0A835YMA9_9STRA|nr:hypothetical protein JKP88DRAFT_248439 [Tribonema minus]